jgi:hypothetical protein
MLPMPTVIVAIRYEREPGAVGSPLRVHHANFVKPRASRMDALTTAPGDSRGFDPPY